MNYYLLGKNKKPKGPYKLAQLRELWKAGKIPEDTLCCEKGGKKWKPIGQFENITNQTTSEPNDFGGCAVLACAAAAVFYLLYWLSCSGGGGLEGVYTHDGGVGTLSINFRNDGTCIYQIEIMGVTKDFDGTYAVSGSEVTVKHDGAKSEQVYKMTGDGALIGPAGGRFEKR